MRAQPSPNDLPAPTDPPDLTSLAVKALVLYALAEHQAGHASEIRVTVGDTTFCVADNGRGHAIDRAIDGTPYLDFIYEQVRYPFGAVSAGAIQLQGIGMSLVNALCGRLEVKVQKHNASLLLSFEHGQLRSRERVDVQSADTGNEVRGTISGHLHAHAARTDLLLDWLRSIHGAAPALQIFFNGELVDTAQGVGA